MTKCCRWDFKHHFWNVSVFPKCRWYSKVHVIKVLKEPVIGFWDPRLKNSLDIYLKRMRMFYFIPVKNNQSNPHTWGFCKVLKQAKDTKCALFSNVLIYQLNNIFSSSMSDLCSFSYLCLMSGMLMQLAEATAAKGTNLPIRGETRWKTHREGKTRKTKMYLIIVFIEMLHLLMTDQTYFLYIKIQWKLTGGAELKQDSN